MAPTSATTTISLAKTGVASEYPDQSTDGSVLRRMLVGSTWMVAARWSTRAIGLVSTIVLARLLSPPDFGLVAMGMITVGFVRIFAEAGQHLAIIRHPDPQREHFDTAWTMSISFGAIVAVVLMAIAPFAGRYFHDPRAVGLVRFLALAPVIDGFTNVGAIAGFRKNLAFDKEFRFLVVRKLAGFLITLPLAFILQDYRALALGIVVGTLLTVVASYYMHPYRPRLCVTKLREIWSFSAWSQVASVAAFFGGQTDQLVVGNLAGAAQMGNYNVALDVATAPTSEIVLPTARALYPVYATLLHSLPRLAQAYLDALSLVAIFALSTGVGVAAVSRDMVLVVLGSKWSDAVILVPWLAVSGAVSGMLSGVDGILTVTGNARLYAMQCLAFAGLLAIAVIIGALLWDVEGIAIARAAILVFFAPVQFYLSMRIIPITAGQIIERTWRPTFAAFVMWAVVTYFGGDIFAQMVPRLICNVGLGAIVFTTTLLALWYIAGRPAGGEHVLLAHTTKAIRSLSARAVRRVRSIS